jgi:hypothetical protein
MAVERMCRLPTETILSFYDPDPGMDIAPLLESIAVPTLDLETAMTIYSGFIWWLIFNELFEESVA